MDPIIDSEEEDEVNPQHRHFRIRQYFELENFGERFRLTRQQFQNLANLIGPRIAPKLFANRHALSVQDKLILSLRFLASGGLDNLVGDASGPVKISVAKSLRQVVRAINAELFQSVIKFPDDMGKLFVCKIFEWKKYVIKIFGIKISVWKFYK
jgi:hypothetical protein